MDIEDGGELLEDLISNKTNNKKSQKNQIVNK
jgi:hypothetical protein